jgi:hypothetical protein
MIDRKIDSIPITGGRPVHQGSRAWAVGGIWRDAAGYNGVQVCNTAGYGGYSGIQIQRDRAGYSGIQQDTAGYSGNTAGNKNTPRAPSFAQPKFSGISPLFAKEGTLTPLKGRTKHKGGYPYPYTLPDRHHRGDVDRLIDR